MLLRFSQFTLFMASSTPNEIRLHFVHHLRDFSFQFTVFNCTKCWILSFPAVLQVRKASLSIIQSLALLIRRICIVFDSPSPCLFYMYSTRPSMCKRLSKSLPTLTSMKCYFSPISLPWKIGTTLQVHCFLVNVTITRRKNQLLFLSFSTVYI